MFKFINPNKEETVFEEKVVEVDKKSSPFKEILEKKDFSGFSISLNEQTISLMDSFQLQVNVKSVGTFRFIFNKEGFEKEEIINQVTALKDIEIIDIRTAQNKIDALLSIINKPYLLFMIYEGLDDLYINNDYFHQQINKDIQTFLIKKEKDNNLYELSIGNNEKEEQISKGKKEHKKIEKGSIRKLFKEVADKKFHFLLIIVSTTLFEVSLPLAIVNIYSNNAIYIFLFICALIGLGMNGYSFYDLFKKQSPISSLSIASYVSNLIGIGIGIGLFALFYHLSNLPEEVPSMGKMMWIGALISIITCIAIVGVSYLISKVIKKDKNSKVK